MRDEADGVEVALAEAIRIGQEAGLPVQVSHHKLAGRRNWGRSAATLARFGPIGGRISGSLGRDRESVGSIACMRRRVGGRRRVTPVFSAPTVADGLATTVRRAVELTGATAGAIAFRPRCRD